LGKNQSSQKHNAKINLKNTGLKLKLKKIIFETAQSVLFEEAALEPVRGARKPPIAPTKAARKQSAGLADRLLVGG